LIKEKKDKGSTGTGKKDSTRVKQGKAEKRSCGEPVRASQKLRITLRRGGGGKTKGGKANGLQQAGGQKKKTKDVEKRGNTD